MNIPKPTYHAWSEAALIYRVSNPDTQLSTPRLMNASSTYLY